MDDRDAKALIFGGAFGLIASISISVVTFAVARASSTGGYYVVFIGAGVASLVALFRGLLAITASPVENATPGRSVYERMFVVALCGSIKTLGSPDDGEMALIQNAFQKVFGKPLNYWDVQRISEAVQQERGGPLKCLRYYADRKTVLGQPFNFDIRKQTLAAAFHLFPSGGARPLARILQLGQALNLNSDQIDEIISKQEKSGQFVDV
jgi:hypothetical protein